jgi:hypothetical protein
MTQRYQDRRENRAKLISYRQRLYPNLVGERAHTSLLLFNVILKTHTSACDSSALIAFPAGIADPPQFVGLSLEANVLRRVNTFDSHSTLSKYLSTPSLDFNHLLEYEVWHAPCPISK